MSHDFGLETRAAPRSCSPRWRMHLTPSGRDASRAIGSTPRHLGRADGRPGRYSACLREVSEAGRHFFTRGTDGIDTSRLAGRFRSPGSDPLQAKSHDAARSNAHARRSRRPRTTPSGPSRRPPSMPTGRSKISRSLDTSGPRLCADVEVKTVRSPLRAASARGGIRWI